MAGGIVESAAAGDQAEPGVARRTVNGFRGEIGFEVLPHAGDAENGRDPVGKRHIDGVSGTQGPEAKENGRPPVTVDVALNDRCANLTGVAEYLYHAARSALVVSDGTCIDPSAFTPRRRSLELTPIAGISTDTGSERASDGPRPAGPRTPALARDGWGACCWALTAKPTAASPVARRSDTGHPGQAGPEADPRPGAVRCTHPGARRRRHETPLYVASAHLPTRSPLPPPSQWTSTRVA